MSLSRPGGSEVEENEHVARCQAVNPQLIERRLGRRILCTGPGFRLLLGLFEEVPQQNGRAHVQAQDDTRLLHTVDRQRTETELIRRVCTWVYQGGMQDKPKDVHCASVITMSHDITTVQRYWPGFRQGISRASVFSVEERSSLYRWLWAF